MTNEKQEEAGPVTVQVGVCSVCHALFMLSGNRETSPCHGADPLAVLATLTIGSNGQVTGEWGMGGPIGEGDIREEPAPAAAPLEEPPAEEVEALRATGAVTGQYVLQMALEKYLHRGEGTPDELRQAFLDVGAEPEAAATAVGRLEAVRELLQTLEPPREAVPVAPAPPEAESSPSNT